MKYIATVNEQEYIVDIVDEEHILVNGAAHSLNYASVSDEPVFSLLLDGKSYEAFVYESEQGWEVLLQGSLYSATVVDEREHRLRSVFGKGAAPGGEFYLKAPMPGLVVDIPVRDGQEVNDGDVLVILESMKMQNELKSPRAGKVARMRVRTGDHVERRQTLLSVV
ncbi:MAG: biotin/lipoyl-binding protein [Chloroflexi bacterium]|nr:biotin/lipoyl-binding protein [Chloroflexota bacterium]